MPAARSTLTQASRMANFDPEMQVEIAGLQVMAGHLPGASYSVEKALSSQPDHLPARILQAELLARQGEYAKSDAQLRDILKAHPRSPVAHHLQGTSYMARGQAAPAIESFRRAHQASPSSATFFALFEALAAHDRPAAVSLGQQWIQSRPKDVKARHAVAELLVRTANMRAAKAAYEEILRLSPRDAAALNNLANVQLRLGDRGALATAEQALALQPASATVLDTAGWAAHQAGQHERALQLLRDARVRDPSQPAIRYHLASVLARAGRVAEAKEELTAALAAGAAFEDRAEAQALLRTLK
jgi:tetratricopeptide (TPR) repeat protein